MRRCRIGVGLDLCLGPPPKPGVRSKRGAVQRLLTREAFLSDHDSHVRQIDAKVTALSDALAHLGKGTSLRELLKIIRFPGYTTPAELAFTIAVLEGMEAQVRTLAKMENDLLAASKLVVQGGQKAA